MTSACVQATCFGFEIRSSLPFHYLRAGSGEPLHVYESSEQGTSSSARLVREWKQTDPPLDAALHSEGDCFRLWIARCGWFAIDPHAPSIGVPSDGDPIRREERLWGIPTLLCFLSRGDLPLHAAAIEVDDGAVLLAGPRTQGKTTLAAGFACAGYRVLSEDLSCLDLASERPAVIPGPAMLRVRQDVAARLQVPDASPIATTDDRVHFSLAASGRGDSSPVPVRAIVVLQPEGDGILLERVRAAEVIPDLFALSFSLPLEAQWSRRFEGAADLARSIPVWRVGYPRELDRLHATVEAIVGRV